MNANDLTTKIKTHIASDRVYRIVFLGDSITSAEWVHPNWPEIVEYVLKCELSKQTGDWQTPSWNIRCINSALDGSTSQDMLERFAEHVTYYKPNLVIYLQSSNDNITQISAAQSGRNNAQLVSQILEQGSDLVLANSTPGNNQTYTKALEPYVESTKTTCFANDKIIAIDIFDQMQTLELARLFTFASPGIPEVGMKPGDIDYMHPNPLGNAYIAKYILQEGFGIVFDPEEYISQTNAGVMQPLYMG